MDDMIRKVPVKIGGEAPSAPPVPRSVLAGSAQVKSRTTIPIRDESAAPAAKLPNASALNFKPLTSVRPAIQAEPSDLKGSETIDQPADMAPDESDTTPIPEIKRLPPDEPPKPPHHNPIIRFFGGYWHHKLWTLPLTLLVLISAAAAVPQSRYPVLALFMTRQFSVTVVDSTTHTPVTGATVMLDGHTTETGSTGIAYITAKVGRRTVTVTKKYYQDKTQTVFVGVATGDTHNAVTAALVATGRQVPIAVIDKISGKALPNVAIRVADTEARSDVMGQATIVLPTDQPTQAAAISADGYTTLNANVQVTSDVVAANTFALVPTGRIYFLSNLSGNIDVVSTNLDGSGRKTILAGTGSEDAGNTVLLASRDWQYLALLSKRDGGQYAKLFLINTSSGTTKTIDGSQSTFTLVGWSDHSFVYQSNNSTLQPWQPNKLTLKSYEVDSGKTITLDQAAAEGSSTAFAHQNFTFVSLVNDRIVYGLSWVSLNDDIVGKTNIIASISADGTNKKDLRDLTIPGGVTDTTELYATLVNPGELYVQSYMGSQPTVYYTYKYQNDSVTQSDTVTDGSFANAQQTATTYLLSPTGQATFWSQTRDGKNTLFVGDSAGLNDSQIASLSPYTPYGWYTDNYLLVQKGGSELYVMPAAGGTPLKVSDYYKPQYTFYGYGGGYGGL